MEDIDPGRYVLPALLALLMLGTFLIIVTNGGGDDSAGPVDRPPRSSSRTSTATTARSTTPTIPPAPAPTPAGARFVKVQPGDTPTSIADRSGISTERLLELNPSVKPDALKPGQTLKLAP